MEGVRLDSKAALREPTATVGNWSTKSSDLRQPEGLRPLLEQELSQYGVFCQTDGPVVSVGSFSSSPKLLQEMGANRPVGLIVRYGFRVDRLQNGEPDFRSVRFGNRGSVSGSSAERRRYPEQLFVEQNDRRPVGPTGTCAFSVNGLDGSLELKSSDARVLESLGQVMFRFFYQGKRPLLRVLLGQWNVPSLGVPSLTAARFAMEPAN